MLLHLSLPQAMREHTERMRDAILRRVERKEREAWNQPDQHDWYLMQIAAEIRVSRGVERVKLADMAIDFNLEPDRPETEEERQQRIAVETAIAKVRAANALGQMGRKRKK